MKLLRIKGRTYRYQNPDRYVWWNLEGPEIVRNGRTIPHKRDREVINPRTLFPGIDFESFYGCAS